MSFRLPQGLSFFKGSNSSDLKETEACKANGPSPSLRLLTDNDVYRPGDLITLTIDIEVPLADNKGEHENVPPFLVDNLSFEIKGIEKLDSQWFSAQKLPSGPKQKRGEHLLLDCSASSLISKVVVSSGCSKTFLVRAELPNLLPPSYRGTTIRYLYYAKCVLLGRFLAISNGDKDKGAMNYPIKVEARVPLQIWASQKGNISLIEDGLHSDDSFSSTTTQIDAYWREKDMDSEWIRANDADGVEDGYDSSRDETSSVSSYNPRGIDSKFRSSFSLLSNANRYSQGEQSELQLYPLLSDLSVAEVVEESSGGILPDGKTLGSLSPSVLSPGRHKSYISPFSGDDTGRQSTPGSESLASESFIRGRSYNIRIDDQILLRYSPKNSDASYYFGDVLGGTLTFFHGEGSRRCLEVSITLEISETINSRFVHPSRRNSPTITKIQGDHHEVVADIVQTSFLFSIPMDGPMSFSTQYVSIKWALRFEFFTTPKHVDWTRYEHPLLVEDREKGEWILPITVNVPPPRNQAAKAINEKSLSIGHLSVQV